MHLQLKIVIDIPFIQKYNQEKQQEHSSMSTNESCCNLCL